MSDALRLYGTRAIVTSAADGIGEAVVRTFIKQGAEVVAIDHPDSGVDAVYKGIQTVIPLPAKLPDAETVKAVVKDARDEMGGIDVLVNIAFMQPKTPIAEDDQAAYDALIEQKINRYSMLARAALPHLERSPAGRIVNVGCLRSAFAVDAVRAFRNSERAIAELTAKLAEDAARQGTNVTYLQPGAVMTPASRRVFRNDKALRDYCIRSAAAGRVGEPVDIAKAILFLASDDSVFVTGTGLIVDGGARTPT
ncbi:MAG: SDR family oxidoreductase [Woeseiaceae bacterium]|nr:SDR family oxidoreductase [Woeseiaceae bacterium]